VEVDERMSHEAHQNFKVEIVGVRALTTW
jgi:hypothetical protein